MIEQAPFLYLGHDRGQFFYFCLNSGQIVELRADQHVSGRLLALAPRQYWGTSYPFQAGIDWMAAANALIQQSYKTGIYDPGRLRGRGAWWDTDHAIVHAGDRLIIRGEIYPLLTGGTYIYESSLPYPINPENPLDAKSAYKLIEICNLISWENPISSYYLAGWLAMATVGGALEWRPHVWLTGASSSGKSWVMREIAQRLLGEIAINNQSCTTEPAIRGQLNNGALPIILDEIESKSKNQKLRVESLIDLARAASTKDGAPITKARPDGSTRAVRVRSMFLFASISYMITKPEDQRRITPLAIVKDKDKTRFDKLELMTAAVLTDEYRARFCARSIAMIPVIRQSSRIFGSILTAKYKSQALGDQYGALLAGAWTLYSDHAPSLKQATEWIETQHLAGAWTEQEAQEQETDEKGLLDHLLTSVVRVQAKSGPTERSIATLLEISAEKIALNLVSSELATEVLGLRGFRADPHGISVSTTHTGIGEILKDTGWSRNWGRTLKRLPGAHITRGTIWFGATKSRAIVLPWPKDEDDAPGDAQEHSEAQNSDLPLARSSPATA